MPSYIYIIHQHVNSKFSRQHTKRQLAAAISPFMTPKATKPAHDMNDMCNEVHHTIGKMSPTLFKQQSWFFSVPFQFTNEIRMKETRPMP